MKNILVTGGCGFIASNFINHFLKSLDFNEKGTRNAQFTLQVDIKDFMDLS